MRDATRIPRVLDAIREVWEREPEMRLAQLLVNAAKAGSYEDVSQSKMFYIEDDQLLEGLKNIEKLKERKEKTGNGPNHGRGKGR
jgi:uncharacterized protein YihD (DUF1040 family)